MVALAWQVLKQANEHMAPPADAIAAVLAAALQQDVAGQHSGMSETSSDLLKMWKQCCPSSWELQLSSESACSLQALCNRQQDWPTAVHIFQAWADASMVCKPASNASK